MLKTKLIRYFTFRTLTETHFNIQSKDETKFTELKRLVLMTYAVVAESQTCPETAVVTASSCQIKLQTTNIYETGRVKKASSVKFNCYYCESVS